MEDFNPDDEPKEAKGEEEEEGDLVGQIYVYSHRDCGVIIYILAHHL